jgi:hypothetical protein
MGSIRENGREAYPTRFQMAKVERGEAVWKIVGRVGSGASWSSKTSKRRLFTPSPRLIRPRNGAYLEFPDSLWKGFSQKLDFRFTGLCEGRADRALVARFTRACYELA